MQRDGARQSLWQHKMPAFQSAVTSTPPGITDVLIIGGGITGVTTSLLLQLSGKKCVLAEAKSLCFGTTGGTTAHINTVLDHPYSEIESKFGEDNSRLLANGTVQAVALIREMIQRYKIDCEFKEQEGYLFAQDEKQEEELKKILQASEKAGIDMQYISSIPVPIPFKKAVVFPGQAKFHPARYVYALANAFEDAGGILLQGCTVEKVEENDVLEVSTSIGKIRARHIIWATHIPPGVNLLHFRCAPYRSYAMALKLKNNKYPDGLVYDMYDPYHYYRSQEIDGELYLIAGGEDHKTAHEKNTNECFTKLEAYLRKFFDIDTIAFKWSSQYFEPVDGLPYIGHLPGNPNNVYVATGFGGNGMVFGTLSALVLHDILVNGKSSYQDLFDPNRLKPVAGFSNFVKEASDVVGKMIGGWISADKIKEFSELGRDEARVVKYENHRLALYKDEIGKVHAVNPVCPHAKCMVEWNSAEKSWDCPCHGSRFNVDGKFLTGPTSKDLEKVELKELIDERVRK